MPPALQAVYPSGTVFDAATNTSTFISISCAVRYSISHRFGLLILTVSRLVTVMDGAAVAAAAAIAAAASNMESPAGAFAPPVLHCRLPSFYCVTASQFPIDLCIEFCCRSICSLFNLILPSLLSSSHCLPGSLRRTTCIAHELASSLGSHDVSKAACIAWSLSCTGNSLCLSV